MLFLKSFVFLLSISYAYTIAIQSFFLWSKALISVIDEANDIYGSFSGTNLLGRQTKERKLYNTLINITHLIEQVERDIPQVTIAKIKELERDFSKIIHFEIKLDDLVDHIGNIESKYEKFLSKLASYTSSSLS